MIGTATCLDGQTTVFPQRPLGPKAVRSLQNAQQHSCPDRADRGNLAEPFPRLVFLAFLQQFAPNFPPQGPQRVELLVVKLRPAPYPWLGDFRQPLHTMLRCIDLLAATSHAPTAIDRLHA